MNCAVRVRTTRPSASSFISMKTSQSPLFETSAFRSVSPRASKSETQGSSMTSALPAVEPARGQHHSVVGRVLPLRLQRLGPQHALDGGARHVFEAEEGVAVAL